MTLTIKLLALIFLPFIASTALSDKPLTEEFLFLSHQKASGTFKQERIINALPIPLTSEGNFIYDSEKGITWNTTTPIQSNINISLEGISIDGERMNNVGHQLFRELLLAIFSGNFSALNNQFKVQEAKEPKNQILLTPTNKNIASKIQKIIITGRDFIEAVAINETNGDSTIITLSLDPLTKD